MKKRWREESIDRLALSVSLWMREEAQRNVERMKMMGRESDESK